LELESSEENKVIISCLYRALDRMAYDRQKSNKTISDEVFRYYEVAFEEIEEFKKLESGSVPSEFIQFLEKNE